MSQEAGDVHLFATCLADAFFPQSAQAACDVLRDAGCKVHYDGRQSCCGQPAMNLGHRGEARVLARETMGIYAGDDRPVVVPSGSCAAMMARHYPDLFPEGSREHEEAKRFAARVVEWSAYLERVDYHPPRREGLPPVTLHPSCHGLRELGIRDEPRRLLQEAGYPLVDLPRGEECCGFGGAFSVVLPEMSGAILQAKRANVAKSVQKGAQIVASLDAGCLMHMRGGDEQAMECREGEKGCPRYRHVAQLLGDSIRSRERGDSSAPPS